MKKTPKSLLFVISNQVLKNHTQDFENFMEEYCVTKCRNSGGDLGRFKYCVCVYEVMWANNYLHVVCCIQGEMAQIWPTTISKMYFLSARGGFASA